MENRMRFLLLSVLFLGTVSVFAGNVFVGEGGIRGEFSSLDGSKGLTANLSYTDGDGVERFLSVKNGLIVGFVEESGNSSNLTWWDSSWSKRKVLSNLTGNISYLQIDYDEDMRLDFGDVRFVDSGELIEMNYTLEDYVSGDFAEFRVNNLNKRNISMYYGNAVASTTSNASNVYFNPIAAYYFDSNADDFVGNNSGVINGATLSNGYIEGGFDFDGNDYIGASDSTSLDIITTDLTFSSWIKINTFTPNGRIVGKGDTTFRTWISSTDNRICMGLHCVSHACHNLCSTGFSTDRWYLVTATYDGSNMKLYIDGILSGSSPESNPIVPNDYELWFGNDAQYTYRYFDGKIDEVLIYDKALTSEQIMQLYTQTAPNFVEGSEESG